MKVITIKQPWASLIANGYKEYEFRSWKTNYRGPIYIHSSKTIDKDAMKRFKDLNIDYPTSEIIAVCNLADCIKVSDIKIDRSNEVYKSAPTDGYGWKLENIKKITNSKKIKGKLSIWNTDQI